MRIPKRICCLLLSFAMCLTWLIGCEEETGVIIPPTTDEVAYLVSTMTLREKIGQMIMMDFRCWKDEDQENEHNMKQLSDEVRDVIKEYNIGGVILFSENISNVGQVTTLNNQIQQASSNGIPLFIGTDQEGGLVTRVKEGLALPGNMALGALDDADYAFESSNIVGKELRARGFNMNFAPVLDVNSNPKNPVIGLRSFGSSAESVATLGVASMHGYQMQGIIPAVKHFPGHGDTSADSHTTLPIVNKTKSELYNIELKPFQAAINNGLDAMMVGHIQYPEIEKTTVISKVTKERINLPATLSYEIITNLLRKELGFSGVVITDALNMAAITDHFGEDDAVVRAIGAGADILMMPTEVRSKKDIYKLERVYRAVESAIEKGTIKISEIDDSVRRILNLKQQQGLLQNGQIFDVTVAESLVATTSARDFERTISQEAITCLKNDVVEVNGNERLLLPYETNEKTVVSIFTPYQNEAVGIEYGMKRAKELYNLKMGSYNIETYMEEYKPSDNIIDKVKDSNLVIIYTDASGNYKDDNWAVSYPNKLIEKLDVLNIPYIIVCGGLPYEAGLYNEQPALLVSYGIKGSSDVLLEEGLYPRTSFGPNIPATLDVIFGKVENKGTLPVDVYDIDEDGEFTDDICFSIGEGMGLKFFC